MVERKVPVIPHLLIDARPLDGKRNGITRFVEQLIAFWPSSSSFHTTLISNRPIFSNAPIPEGINCFYDTHIFGSLPGTLWMNLRVPAIAHRLAATHFLGTQHVLPLLKTGQLTHGVIVHDLVFELFPETMTHTNRLISRFFAPRSIRRAEHIFCVSKTTQSDLRRQFGIVADRAKVCYPGRSELFDEPPSINRSIFGEIHLLLVGSIEPRKNIALFIETFLIAADQNEKLSLDLVSGDSWGHLIGVEGWQSIRKHPRIRIHQRITDQELKSLYKKATYLVFPSVYEGFGLPIIEAVGNCAVIANDIPIFREIAEKVDGVKLLNMQTNSSDIAASLLKFIALNEHPPVANDHGFFSWQVTANRIVNSMGLGFDTFQPLESTGS